METDPQGSALCNITRGDKGVGVLRAPQMPTPTPAQTGHDHPGGCSLLGKEKWHQQRDTDHWNRERRVHPAWLWPKRETELQGGAPRDPKEPGPPEGPLPLELVVAQGGHSPGPQGVVNGFGKFIHVFPFLFTLITEIPYTKHSPSCPPPALEQRDLSQGNTDMSCSLRNAVSQGTAFLFFLFCHFFSSFFLQNNTGNTSNV